MQVEDTAFDQNPHDVDDAKFWGKTQTHDVLARICKPLSEGKITREEAGKLAVELGVDSCKEQPGVDNIFNYMSYSPDECQMELSPGQVQFMQQAIMKHRPGLYKAAQSAAAAAASA